MARGAVNVKDLVGVGVETFGDKNRRICAARVTAFLACMEMPSKAVEVNLGRDVSKCVATAVAVDDDSGASNGNNMIHEEREAGRPICFVMCWPT
jgi:hypothetical protein